MKIWFLTGEFAPDFGGGIGTYVENCAKMFAQHGEEVTVIVRSLTSNSDKMTKDGYRVVRFKQEVGEYYNYLGTSNALAYQYYEVIMKLIDKYGKPDVIEMQEYNAYGQYIIQNKLVLKEKLQDIPLVTVLRSSIANFTDNDLVQIRLNDGYDYFYNAMLKTKLTADETLKEKINSFLDNVENWRKAKEYLSLDELVWKIYTETGYYNYVGLMPNGALRQANLKMLFERAKQYESASFKGLFNFINFIEKVHSGSGDLGSAKIIGENEDVVRIMSIHKSKGLEFPIVFLSNTGKTINLMDLKENLLLHNEIGIGTKFIDYNMQIEYDTLTKSAIANKMHLETIAEEMRILYVALTRAKEKLIITGTYSNAKQVFEKMDELISRYAKTTEKINPILIKKYTKYLDWLILVYKYNEDIKDICTFNLINKNDINIKKEQDENNIDDIYEKLNNAQIDDSRYEKIKKLLEYKYPDIALSTIPTKASVSKLKEKAIEESLESIDVDKIFSMSNTQKVKEEINFAKPKFMSNQENKITNSEKGTLIHLCMQKLNNSKNYTLADVKELIEDLKSKNQITEKQAEAIDPSKIYKFTQNNLWKRMQNSKTLCKEKAFYINIPIKDVYKQDVSDDLQGDILVQGIIDLYFIDENNKLVLLDYKTDYVEIGKEETLVKKYEVQLKLYKTALEESLRRKVDEVYIYSTYLDKLINVNL